MERSGAFVERSAAFGLGAAVILSLQPVYGWWLDSGNGVLRTTAALAILGLVAALWGRGGLWIRALALWIGAISASTAVLLWTGPGNIWPIVLLFAATLSAGAVVAGSLLGLTAHHLRR